MKKIFIIAAVLSVNSAFATNYGCEYKGGAARQQCEQQVNNTHWAMIKNTYEHNKRFVLTSPDVPAAAKAKGRSMYNAFEQQCSKGCNMQTWNGFNYKIQGEFGKYYKGKK